MRFCGLFCSEKRCRFGAGLLPAIRRAVTAAFWPLGIKSQRQPEQKCWQISLCVPRELINELCGYAGFEHVFALNLYKISETAEHEHYVALNPINEEKPNFHLPQYFTLACAQDAE